MSKVAKLPATKNEGMAELSGNPLETTANTGHIGRRRRRHPANVGPNGLGDASNRQGRRRRPTGGRT